MGKSAQPSAPDGDGDKPPVTRRKQVAQADIPSMSLRDALRVPRGLAEYAFRPVSPLDAAKAIGMQPASGHFRMLMGAAQAYGLTEGGAFAEKVAATDLARRIVKPTVEGDDMVAMREALLRPRVVREFLTGYKNNKVPRKDIAINVLEGMGVPPDHVERVLKQILDDAQDVGFITVAGSSEYIQLDGINLIAVRGDAEPVDDVPSPTSEPVPFPTADPTPTSAVGAAEAKRVYITHGSNKAFVELLKKFLKFGDMEAVVSVEKETVSQPVPQKVIGDMRGCGAAIIHVDAERRLLDAEGNEHILINENVLIEIGAAMALFGRRFILLVRNGVQLPSNLQGLYEVRYDGEVLDAEVAMRLLEAIADIKNHPLPGGLAA
jgi:hypothetical protein